MCFLNVYDVKCSIRARSMYSTAMIIFKYRLRFNLSKGELSKKYGKFPFILFFFFLLLHKLKCFAEILFCKPLPCSSGFRLHHISDILSTVTRQQNSVYIWGIICSIIDIIMAIYKHATCFNAIPFCDSGGVSIKTAILCKSLETFFFFNLSQNFFFYTSPHGVAFNLMLNLDHLGGSYRLDVWMKNEPHRRHLANHETALHSFLSGWSHSL